MPRQDVNDNRGLHNLAGIDLRKNADQNRAWDACNLHLDMRHFLVNRRMPKVYEPYNGQYYFACECKNLAGAEVELDISPLEGSPKDLKVNRGDKDAPFYITGTGLRNIREIVVESRSGDIQQSGNDFSFRFRFTDPERTQERIDIEDSEKGLPTAEGTVWFIISPYGEFHYEVSE